MIVSFSFTTRANTHFYELKVTLHLVSGSLGFSFHDTTIWCCTTNACKKVWRFYQSRFKEERERNFLAERTKNEQGWLSVSRSSWWCLGGFCAIKTQGDPLRPLCTQSRGPKILKKPSPVHCFDFERGATVLSADPIFGRATLTEENELCLKDRKKITSHWLKGRNYQGIENLKTRGGGDQPHWFELGSVPDGTWVHNQ